MGSLQEARCARLSVAPGERERKIRTVVVDDVAAMLDTVCGVLETQDGIEIVGRAHDGAEAVQRVEELGPDLVVMDVRMPRMDGLEATRLVTQHFPEIRVVLMSGEESPELREESRRAGAHGFVFKVVFAHEFLPMLRRLFDAPSLDFIA